jgi:hypothetical protein
VRKDSQSDGNPKNSKVVSRKFVLKVNAVATEMIGKRMRKIMSIFFSTVF